MLRLALALAILPTAALAHPGHGTTGGFAAGLAHPLGGLDHLLAMFAVGLWAAVAGGKALWVLPLAFVAALGVGGALGMAGVALPAVEPAILVSIVVIGALAAFAARPPLWAGVAIVALFALAHGHAHGTEGPAAQLGAYAAGFMLASLGLHVAGMGFGLATERVARAMLPRVAGGLAAVAGLGLMVTG